MLKILLNELNQLWKHLRKDFVLKCHMNQNEKRFFYLQYAGTKPEIPIPKIEAMLMMLPFLFSFICLAVS